MSQVQVVPITDFVHGQINASEGRPLSMEEGLAGDLERAGLVRIKLLSPSKSEPVKTPGDGQGQSSPVSHPAPASPPKTSSSSRTGGRPGKTDG